MIIGRNKRKELEAAEQKAQMLERERFQNVMSECRTILEKVDVCCSGEFLISNAYVLRLLSIELDNMMRRVEALEKGVKK